MKLRHNRAVTQHFTQAMLVVGMHVLIFHAHALADAKYQLRTCFYLRNIKIVAIRKYDLNLLNLSWYVTVLLQK